MTDTPKNKPTPPESADITALSELALSEDASEDKTRGDLIREDIPPPVLEGLDDLLNPMTPTSTGLGAGGEISSSFTFSADPNAPTETLTGIGDAALLDPIANLEPIGPETLAAAAGTDALSDLSFEVSGSEDPGPKLEGTAVGALIASALSSRSANNSSTPTSSDSASMDAVRNYSDHVSPASTPETTVTPFSLVIEGPLRPHEKETLLAILSRENLGIREMELEPQFAAGHLLIPRISEYAGVMIVQALRNTTAKIRLGPSERIFVSREADDGDARLIPPPNPDAEIRVFEEDLDHPENVLLTSADGFPGRKLIAAIDMLHTSMNLKSAILAQPMSPIFQESIERLKKQLKSQAHHRGANALVGFKYTLHPLEGHATVKLVVEARAVRIES